MADDASFFTAVGELLRFITDRGIDPAKLQTMLDDQASPLAALPRQIVTAWCLGIVGTGAAARCLAFETALNAVIVADVLRPPTYAYGPHGSWAAPPLAGNGGNPAGEMTADNIAVLRTGGPGSPLLFLARAGMVIGVLIVGRSKVNSHLTRYQRDRNRVLPGSVDVQTSETLVELDYHAQATPWFSLRPNLQYVIRPGGTGEIPDALVVGLNTRIDFQPLWLTSRSALQHGAKERDDDHDFSGFGDGVGDGVGCGARRCTAGYGHPHLPRTDEAGRHRR